MRPKIHLVDHGIANNFGKYIEINRELLSDPDLYEYVLHHELGHVDGAHTIKDFKNDFKINFRMVFKLLLFSIKRPKTWYEFLPIYRKKNRLIYDVGMLISYGILIAVAIAAALLFL